MIVCLFYLQILNYTYLIEMLHSKPMRSVASMNRIKTNFSIGKTAANRARPQHKQQHKQTLKCLKLKRETRACTQATHEMLHLFLSFLISSLKLFFKSLGMSALATTTHELVAVAFSSADILLTFSMSVARSCWPILLLAS